VIERQGDIAGRGRDRTGDSLLAKHEACLQQLLTIPTNRGICFRSKANPNELKTFDSRTLRVQSCFAQTPPREPLFETEMCITPLFDAAFRLG
jgi:hypothetical protein